MSKKINDIQEYKNAALKIKTIQKAEKTKVILFWKQQNLISYLTYGLTFLFCFHHRKFCHGKIISHLNLCYHSTFQEQLIGKHGFQELINLNFYFFHHEFNYLCGHFWHSTQLHTWSLDTKSPYSQHNRYYQKNLLYLKGRY